MTCPRCNGRGYVCGDECPRCEGAGDVDVEEVPTPVGVYGVEVPDPTLYELRCPLMARSRQALGIVQAARVYNWMKAHGVGGREIAILAKEEPAGMQQHTAREVSAEVRAQIEDVAGELAS